MKQFDRVLDRDDVLLSGAVDVINDRCKRGRFAGSGRAGREHEAAVLLRETNNARRQVKLLERGNSPRDDAERDRDSAALPEDIDAEAGQRRRLVTEVDLAGP